MRAAKAKGFLRHRRASQLRLSFFFCIGINFFMEVAASRSASCGRRAGQAVRAQEGRMIRCRQHPPPDVGRAATEKDPY